MEPQSREWGGGIINHGWDFIKLRLSCAQCIVYYLLLRGGFAQLGNTPGTVFCFELAFALPSRSPRWSCRERCRVCGTLAVFPKIESHRAKRVSSALRQPTLAIKHIHEISGWESGLRFRQTAGCPGQTLRAYFRRRRVGRFPTDASCLCPWVSRRVTRDITWIHRAIPLTAGYRDDLPEHTEITFNGCVLHEYLQVHRAFVLKECHRERHGECTCHSVSLSFCRYSFVFPIQSSFFSPNSLFNRQIFVRVSWKFFNNRNPRERTRALCGRVYVTRKGCDQEG